jgi:hypothetical protein
MLVLHAYARCCKRCEVYFLKTGFVCCFALLLYCCAQQNKKHRKDKKHKKEKGSKKEKRKREIKVGIALMLGC